MFFCFFWRMYIHFISTAFRVSVKDAHKTVDRIKCRKPELSAEHVKEILFLFQSGNYTSRTFNLLFILTVCSNLWLERRWRSEAKQSWSRSKFAHGYVPLCLSSVPAWFHCINFYLVSITLKEGRWYLPISTPNIPSILNKDNHCNQVNQKWI